MSQTSGGSNRGIRAAMAIQALEENPNVALIDIIDLLMDSTSIERDSDCSLWHVKGSVRGTIMADAINHAGIDKRAPDDVTQLYLRDEGLVIFDLKNNL